MVSRNVTALKRLPLPVILPSDLDLIRDQNQFDIADVETALKTIRQARRRTHPTDDRTSWYVNLQRAEKFFADCLECGPADSHQTKGGHLSLALEAWSHLYQRQSSQVPMILDAFNTVLEWRGGYRITRGQSTVYFGVALNEIITQRINQMHVKQDMVESRDRLSKSILASFD